MITLTNLTELPPYGYRYHESAIGFRTTPEMAQTGLESVAKALQIARQQNPDYTKESTELEACIAAIKLYTCKRLKSTPRLFKKFCSDPEEEARLREEAKVQRSIHFGQSGAKVRTCKGCGGTRS